MRIRIYIFIYIACARLGKTWLIDYCLVVVFFLLVLEHEQSSTYVTHFFLIIITMSRCMLTQLLCCRSRFGAQASSCSVTTAVVLNSKNVLRHAMRHASADKPAAARLALGQSTILVQQGGEIQDLPVIMRKIGQDDITAMCSSASLVPSLPSDAVSFTLKQHCDADRVIQRLCDADEGLLSFLGAVEELTDDELANADVAKYAFKRLLDFVTTSEQLDTLESCSNASFDRLLNAFLANCDTKSLLDAMPILPLQSSSNSNSSSSTTMTKLCDELLTRSSSDCLSIVEICESIHQFAAAGQVAAAEKFWSALSDQDRHIDEHNIKFIYAVLPRLRVSRRMVMGVLERRIRSIFWRLTPTAVHEIMQILCTCNVPSARSLQTISRWLNTNIHAVDETQLTGILTAFTQLDFSDEQLEKALERYVKAKGVKIQQHALVAAILQHCSAHRLRNPHILNGCSEFFIVHASNLHPDLLRPIFWPFGQLNYQPSNGVRFWKTIELYIDQHLDRLSTSDAVDVMLTCVYLSRYPLNFVQRIFNPYFLDRLHTRTPLAQHPKLRSDLKLFDTAMAIECADYNGPMLPRDHSAKSVWQDGRIKRIVQQLTDVWTLVAGGETQFSRHVVHQQLPLNPLYIIDVLVHPAGMGQLWSFNVHTDRNVYAALLIHVPDHYDSTGLHLNGAQAMRVRHLRKLGLKVVQLEYEQLNRLRVHGVELREYVVDRMRHALPATG